MRCLRLAWANLPGLAEANPDTNKIVGSSSTFYTDMFYYFIRKFNHTFTVLNATYETASQNGGIHYVESVRNGHSDVSLQIVPGLTRIPRNVTVGPINLVLDCIITTFPKVRQTTVPRHSLDFLAMIEWPVWLSITLAVILLALMTIRWIHLYPGSKRLLLFFQCISQIVKSQINQKIGLPNNLKVKLLWLGFLAGGLLFQIASINMIEVYRGVSNRFHRVDDLNEMMREELVPIISSISGCFYYMNYSSHRLQEYFNSLRSPLEREQTRNKVEMLDEVLRTHGASKIAVLWSSLQKDFEKVAICTKYPEIILQNRPYTSKRYFFSRLNYVLMNSKMDAKLRKKVSAYTGFMMNMGLVNNLYQQEIRRRSKSYKKPASPECLFASIEPYQSSFSPLSFTYFDKLFAIQMLCLLFSTGVLLVEVLNG